MKKHVLLSVLGLLIAFSMILGACSPATPPAAEPTKAEAVATEAKPAEPTKAEVVATEAKPAEPTKAEAAATEAKPAEATKVEASADQLVFGMLLVGPYNDKGWSQAHYEAGQYVEQKLGAKMLYIDGVNPASRPGTTPAQLAQQLVDQGAKVIIFNSDDMKDGAIEFAKANPKIPVIHASGDTSWKEGKNYQDLPNLVNVMGRIEYGKMIGGCAAALTTKTGKIGYLGPLINDETRRSVASVYLGAKYCWTEIAKKDIKDLQMKVTWIGYWFNIPGTTSDPTQVTDEFFNSGYDVVLSGLDTTEALTEAKKYSEEGKEVWSVAYDHKNACAEAPKVCLGVPYFNWGSSYLTYLTAVKDGTYKAAFEWLGPDWKDINNPDTSHVGFVSGEALSKEAAAGVDTLIKGLAGDLNLWTGPLNLQDGTAYLKEGEVASDLQVWYLPQLLEGIEGQGVSK